MKVGFLRLVLLMIVLIAGPGEAGDPVPAAFSKTVPDTVADLKQIQKHVQALTVKLLPVTVGIRIGPSSGSGVIIDAEGHVLTAGHVSGEANRDCEIILSTGKKYKGKTLGANRGIDSGLIKIVDAGPFPFITMGDVQGLKKGTWCMAIGHPGGFQSGRAPVVRLGRVLDKSRDYLRTDCALVGGDSGGPLFDMEGRVVGIHSRIGGSMTSNIHVPINTYRESWDRLASSEVWGEGLFVSDSSRAYLGVTLDSVKRACVISEITSKSPAEKAGLKIDDQIVRVDGQLIQNANDLVQLIKGRRPGQEIAVEVQRGESTLRMRVHLEKKPSS